MSELKDVEILEKVKAILTNSFDLIDEEKSDEFEEAITSARELMLKFKENEIEEGELVSYEQDDIELAIEVKMLFDASLGSDDWDSVTGYIEEAIDIVDELIENESEEEEEEEEEDGDDDGEETSGEETEGEVEIED